MTPEERAAFYEDDQPHDMISEIADLCTPIYNGDIFECAASDSECWDIDDRGLTEGLTDVVKILQVHIYSALETSLWETWRELKDKHDEELEEQEEKTDA